MITQELVSFIKEELAKGKTNEQIKFEIISTNEWSENDVNEAFGDINKIPKSNSFLKILLTLILIISSFYLILEVFLFSLITIKGMFLGPLLLIFGLIFPVYNAISIPVFSLFTYLTLIALVGVILFIFARYRGLKVKKYFLIIFILVVLISILDINNISKNAKEDDIRLTQTKSEAQIHFTKLSEEFTTPAVLGDIEFFYHENPEGGSHILFSVNGKLFDESAGTIEGVGFRYDYCDKNSKEDDILQTYFNEHKNVIVYLPKDYSKYSLGYPGSTEIGTTKAGPILIKDEAGNVIPEFYNLFSRCSYQKIWLPERHWIEQEQALPPVIY